MTKVLGLKSHTFDIRNVKYAAKYKKTVDVIANHIQKEYKGGPDIAKAIRELSLQSLVILAYLTAKARETVVDPREVFLWKQYMVTAKKQIV